MLIFVFTNFKHQEKKHFQLQWTIFWDRGRSTFFEAEKLCTLLLASASHLNCSDLNKFLRKSNKKKHSDVSRVNIVSRWQAYIPAWAFCLPPANSLIGWAMFTWLYEQVWLTKYCIHTTNGSLHIRVATQTNFK